MRAKRWEINLYAFYDHTGMERHLESMAARGWLLENIGTFFWRYRRIEPRALRFNVAYYPDASEYDPIEPSERQQSFWDYCAQAGWTKVANRAQMQVFCNEDENAVPIETEAITQVETLHRAAKRAYLFVQWCLIGLSIVQIGNICLYNLRSSLANLLADSETLAFVFNYIVLILLCATELARYHLWLRKARRAAKELGCFTPTRTHLAAQGGLLVLVVLFCAIIFFSNISNWRVYFAAGVYILLLNFAMRAAKEVMRRKNVDSGTAQVMIFGLCVALFSITFALLTCGATAGWFNTPPPATAEAYEYTSRNGETSTKYIYHDPLPLYIEELTETDYDSYSCWRTVSASPFVTQQRFEQETRYGDWGVDAPELFYTIYDVKFAPLFNACLQSELTINSRTRDLQFTAVDPAPWGADGAWREYDAHDGDTYCIWVLTYGRRIVLLNTYGTELTEADMALAGERLGFPSSESVSRYR